MIHVKTLFMMSASLFQSSMMQTTDLHRLLVLHYKFHPPAGSRSHLCIPQDSFGTPAVCPAGWRVFAFIRSSSGYKLTHFQRSRYVRSDFSCGFFRIKNDRWLQLVVFQCMVISARMRQVFVC